MLDIETIKALLKASDVGHWTKPQALSGMHGNWRTYKVTNYPNSVELAIDSSGDLYILNKSVGRKKVFTSNEDVQQKWDEIEAYSKKIKTDRENSQDKFLNDILKSKLNSLTKVPTHQEIERMQYSME